MPNKNGRFGDYGGQFVPETVMPALLELEVAYNALKVEEDFQKEVAFYFREYAGRLICLYVGEKRTKH